VGSIRFAGFSPAPADLAEWSSWADTALSRHFVQYECSTGGTCRGPVDRHHGGSVEVDPARRTTDGVNQRSWRGRSFHTPPNETRRHQRVPVAIAGGESEHLALPRRGAEGSSRPELLGRIVFRPYSACAGGRIRHRRWCTTSLGMTARAWRTCGAAQEPPRRRSRRCRPPACPGATGAGAPRTARRSPSMRSAS
jgi:hypothetical protein